MIGATLAAGRGETKEEQLDGLRDAPDDKRTSGENTPERHDSRLDADDSALDALSSNAAAISHNANATALHLQTNLFPVSVLLQTPTIFETPVTSNATTSPIFHHSLTSPVAIPIVGNYTSHPLRSNLSTSSMNFSVSPGSASTLPSPYLAAMTDLTPLPSPVGSFVSLTPWRRTSSTTRLAQQPTTPNRSRHSSLESSLVPPSSSSASSALPKHITSFAQSPPKRKKGYGALVQEQASPAAANASSSHSRHRSISDFVPEPLHNTRQRHVTVGEGPAEKAYSMQREAFLAAQRGLISTSPPQPQSQVPTPPGSSSGVAEEDDDEPTTTMPDDSGVEYLEIHCGIHNKRRKFRSLRQLGQGTFSTVILATRQPPPTKEEDLPPSSLVAIKVVQAGPSGGADADRIATSLRREVEMLKSISHPSLVHLKACEYTPSRALLVLTYCPGGDLFDLASSNREVLSAGMVQRMFAELVGAVRYLHEQRIVHRDVKLENVLVNLPSAELAALNDPRSHKKAIVTLTDLGLSRRIPAEPESPLLTTRCGSEDYAAPEILLGQPYDGRATDAWALGVLLYALMEGRLPFDAPPGKIDRSRNSHRIARAEWIWWRFGDEDGEWNGGDGGDAAEWEGGRQAVEGLLKKVRMGRVSLESVEGMSWVRDGIRVEGGLSVEGEDEGWAG